LNYYILNDKGEPIHVTDVMEWARWFGQGSEQRIVAQNKLGSVMISTVFLGLDHSFTSSGPPLLYETMIFGGEHDGYQTRCSTYEQAVEMHKVALAKVPV
jgi:hypothetical protein